MAFETTPQAPGIILAAASLQTFIPKVQTELVRILNFSMSRMTSHSFPFHPPLPLPHLQGSKSNAYRFTMSAGSNVSWGAEGGELGGTTFPSHFPLPSRPPRSSLSTQPTKNKGSKSNAYRFTMSAGSNVSWGAEGGELGGTTFPSHFPLPSRPPRSSLSTQPTKNKGGKSNAYRFTMSAGSNVSWGRRGMRWEGPPFPPTFPSHLAPLVLLSQLNLHGEKAVKAMHTGSRALERGKVWV